jgi:hypothetical protein
MKGRIVVVLGLVIAAVSATTASAVELVAWDSFSDGEAGISDSGGVWTQVNHSWSVQDGQAVATADRTRIGYAVMATPVSDAFTVQADITLSPTDLRAAPALVTNWVDNKNNMVTKLEVTPGHPGGMLAVGDQINGQIHSTLCKVERLGLVNGVTYRLSVTRTGDVVTGSVTSLADGSLIGSCSAALSSEAMTAFGAGTGQGLRVKIKDDEDDGGSRWDNFAVFTN